MCGTNMYHIGGCNAYPTANVLSQRPLVCLRGHVDLYAQACRIGPVRPSAVGRLAGLADHMVAGAGVEPDSQDSTVLRLADLELDLVRRKASRSGQRLDLTAKEFTLLTLLLRRQGQVLSRTALAAQVWDMNFDSNTNVVEVAVRRLRGKIDDAFEKKLLHTVRGMGYVLEDRKP